MMPELAKWEPSFKHYNKFDQVMNGLVKLFGDCPGCFRVEEIQTAKYVRVQRKRPSEPAPSVTMLRTVNPLASITGYKGLTPALQKIKQNGIGRYAEEMQKKVDKGYSYLESK
jgi:hypothetical protein